MLFYEGNKPDPKIPKNYYDYKKHHVNAFQDFCYTEEYYYDSNIEEELKKQSYEQVTNENTELVEKFIDLHKTIFQSLNELNNIISDDDFESYTLNNLQITSDDLVFYTYRADELNKDIIYYYCLYYYSKKNKYTL